MKERGLEQIFASGPSEETNLTDTLVLDFCSLQSCEKVNFCSLSHPGFGLCYRSPDKFMHQSETSFMFIEIANFLVGAFDISLIGWKIIIVSTFQCINYYLEFQWKRLTDSTRQPILILTVREEENKNSYLHNRISNFYNFPKMLIWKTLKTLLGKFMFGHLFWNDCFRPIAWEGGLPRHCFWPQNFFL